MKLLLLSTIISLFFNLKTLAQYDVPNAVSYSYPLQLDSSSFYIMGSLLNKTDRDKYSFQNRLNNGIDNWTNVFIYNSETNKTAKLFSTYPVSIYPVESGNKLPINWYSRVRMAPQSGVLANNVIIFAVRTDEYNKDGVIDLGDPVTLYISTKSGSKVKQIAPSDMNVVSWTSSVDDKKLIIKLQKDKNGDKKFADEDEVLYEVELNDDFSKIKMTQINLQ